jgi:ubiquinone biosynthesis protein
LLQKTLLNIEGMGRQLYPDLDLWATAKPLLETWMKDRVSVKGLYKRVKAQLPFWSERLPDIPGMLYELLNDKHQARREQSQLVIHPHRTARRLLLRGLMLGVGISLLVLAVLSAQNVVALGGHQTLICAVTGAVLSLWGCLKR